MTDRRQAERRDVETRPEILPCECGSEKTIFMRYGGGVFALECFDGLCGNRTVKRGSAKSAISDWNRDYSEKGEITLDIRPAPVLSINVEEIKRR